MKRVPLKSKDLNRKYPQYNFNVNKKDKVELLEDEEKFIILNNQPILFFYKEKAVPTLKYLIEHPILKKIIVDMGAIKFVVNGADIMRPGIVKIDPNIKKDEFVLIIDENHQKPLAVGLALYDGPEMQNVSSGKVVKNLHFVGDEIWKK